jgi:hypothetical protein
MRNVPPKTKRDLLIHYLERCETPIVLEKISDFEIDFFSTMTEEDVTKFIGEFGFGSLSLSIIRQISKKKRDEEQKKRAEEQEKEIKRLQEIDRLRNLNPELAGIQLYLS